MSIFYDGQSGPEVREQLNALYAAFAASAYPPSGGMFPTGTYAAPSIRGTADPSTGINFYDNELHLVVNGELVAWMYDGRLLTPGGQPFLSAATAVGSLAAGALLEVVENASGTALRYADGTLECYHSFVAQDLENYPSPGGAGLYAPVDVPFPAAFVAPPSVVVSAGYVGKVLWSTLSGAADLFEMSAYIVSLGAFEAASVSYIARGRWK